MGAIEGTLVGQSKTVIQTIKRMELGEHKEYYSYNCNEMPLIKQWEEW